MRLQRAILNSLCGPLFLCLVAIHPGLRAQTYWHVTHPGANGSTGYIFLTIGGSGQWITAAAQVYDTNVHLANRIAFVRSNDGGETWTDQYADIPRKVYEPIPGLIRNVLQIDSLNVVAIGDSGFVLRTFDGGTTWEEQDIPTAYRVLSVSFSDPLNGILTVAGYYSTIWTTKDGGRHWDTASFQRLAAWNANSTGFGKYRIFRVGASPMYSTNDNWATVDSTPPEYDGSSYPGTQKDTRYCTFGKKGELVAYGAFWLGDSVVHDPKPLMAWSSDNGMHWQDTTLNVWGYGPSRMMTDLDRDTVVAGGSGMLRLLTSFDRGRSWRADTMLADSNTLNFILGITMNASGKLVGAFQEVPLPGAHNYLAVGTFAKSSVVEGSSKATRTRIFPNPATGIVNITTPDLFRSVRVYDILGREVLRGVLDGKGSCSFDVSPLGTGVYSLVFESGSTSWPAGKIAVIHGD